MPYVDDTEYSTNLTDKNGIATFEVDKFYYGGYIKETKTLDKYILRSDEKDTIPFYKDNGVRFLGEIVSEDLKVSSINQDEKETKIEPDMNLDLCQALTYLAQTHSYFGCVNWLVFNDNGTEKLVSKKPLGYDLAWNSLYNDGLVFGEDGIEDLINADFNYSEYSNLPSLKDKDKEKGVPKTYKPTYVTVNGKKYIVRLMRGYNEKIGINDDNSWGDLYSNSIYWRIKGSEWNKLILPLIDDGRFYGLSRNWIRKNMPTLANYSWTADFGGSRIPYRWVQETGYNSRRERAYRGSKNTANAAAGMNDALPYRMDKILGWQPILERVDN